MTTSVTGHRASRGVGWVGRAGLVVVLASTAACGGSSGGGSDTTTGGSTASGAASSASGSATESSTASEAATSAAAPAASASLGKDICGVITKVRADLIKGSPSGAYQAQLVLGLAGMLSDQAKVDDFQTNGDAEAKKTCPTEYAAFLDQAGITTLASL